MTTTYTSGAILSIRRVTGQVEEVVNTQHARHGVIPSAVYAAMVEATAAAGRGQILSQRPNVVTLTTEEINIAARQEILGQLADMAHQFPSAAKAAREHELTAQLATIPLP